MRGSDNHKPQVVLASRKNAGIRVTLLWAADTDTIAVLVRDDSTSNQFELIVEPEDNPMHVYEHPYAYAAWRGSTTCGRRLEQVKAVGVGCDRLPSGEHESGSGAAFEVVLEGGKQRQLLPANEALVYPGESSEGGAS
jgi:hypothetical protein